MNGETPAAEAGEPQGSSGAPSGPVLQSDRIVALDVLRGFALLGILIMNIQSFAMPFAAYQNPTAYGNLQGSDYLVWYFSHLLADQKFMTIFSMLFGAGILLMSRRRKAGGLSGAGVHYRRMAVLLLFGLMHSYLLWYGDILVLYALCGSVAYLFRKQSPARQLILGLVVVSIASAISLSAGLSLPNWPEQQRSELARDFQPPPERIEAEVAAYRGSWTEQMSHRVPAAQAFHTFIFFVWGFWRAGGLMLVGMAFFQWGVLSGDRSRAFYGALAAAALLVGIPAVLYGIQGNEQAGWSFDYSMFLGSQFNYWGSLIVSLGWVGLVMIAVSMPALSSTLRPLACVGQMAFTNYILQTLICTTIFYGHGLGLFGGVRRSGQIAVVFAVWAVQLTISPLWLKRFRFGPLEWLWRSLTYLKWEPIRRPVPALSS